MRHLRKISVWVISGFGVLLLLSVIFLLLLPQFVNQEFFKAVVQDTISQSFGGKIEYERLNISFLPFPRLIIQQGDFTLNPRSNARFDSLEMHLDIASLLVGSISVNEISIESPVFSIFVPEESESQKPTEASELLPLFFGTFMPGIEGLAETINPDQTFLIHNGRVVYAKAGGTILTLAEVDWKLKAKGDQLSLNIRCSSNVGDDISFQAVRDRNNREISGNIEISGFQPQEILNHVSAKTDFGFESSKADIYLTFTADGAENLAVDIEYALPVLNLHREGKAVLFEGIRLGGNMKLSRNDLSATLTGLRIESPKLNLSGEIHMNTGGENIRLKCNGSEIDAASLRETVLDISGEQSDIGDVFNIILGGHVPYIAVSATAHNFAELGDLDNIVIEGRLTNGDVYIPGADKHLSEVHGNAFISKGVLKGSELEAVYGKSSGKNGTLLLGLKSGDDRFDLDINVTADVSQLPPVLRRFIGNEELNAELNRIKEIEGNAIGNLKLNQEKNGIKTQVAVSEFSFTTAYLRAPFPLKIIGNSFRYKGNRIDIGGVILSAESSRFSDIAAVFDWTGKPSLRLSFGKSKVVSQELFPWLLTLENLSDRLKSVTHVTGQVGINRAKIYGDLFQPNQWAVQVDGNVRDLSLKSSALEDGFEISAGNFSANRTQIEFDDLGVGFKDAAVSISGALRDYLKSSPEVNLKFNGGIGSKTSLWVSKWFKLPDALAPCFPMNVEQAKLEILKTGDIKYLGNMTTDNGLNIQVDLEKTHEALFINSLNLKDSVSDAVFQMQLRPETCSLGFSGSFEKTTLDKLIQDHKLVDGRVTGDFRSKINLKYPLKFTAEGSLEAEKVRFSAPPTENLVIHEITLDARANKMQIHKADVDWNGRHLEIDGNIGFLSEGIRLDIDMATGGIYWDDFKKRFLDKYIKTETGSEKKKWDLPVSGKVQVNSAYLKFGHYTWNPFQAEVSLKPNEISVNVSEANLCDISTPGVFTVSPRGTMLNFQTLANKKNLEQLMLCLFPGLWLADGVYNYEGNLAANTYGPFVIQALRGDMELNASEGRIYRFGTLAKIFEFINVAKFLKFEFPDLNTEGFPYTTITNRWRMEDGKLKLQRGIIDSPSSEIVFEGEIDVVEKTVDMQVVVSPLQTANIIIKSIPIIKDIMAGSIVSIPFKVSGKLGDTRVTPLPPESVGKGLLNLLGRTLKAPYKLFQLNSDG